MGDQLSRDLSALQGIQPKKDVILMMEVLEENTYVPHHKHKIILILSAMRHFAARLQEDGFQVDYIKLDDPDNTGSFTGEVMRAVRRHNPERIVVTEPGEWRVLQMMESWQNRIGLPVEIREDERFLCSIKEFAEHANGRKTLRMEFFYREMRRKTGWLMNGQSPEGGSWNYDAENRKPLPHGIRLPERRRFVPDEITDEVIRLVDRRFAHHIGETGNFGWAVTRDDALDALGHFITDCLPRFGDYQDAMKTGEDFVFHSVLSPYINVGLLNPREVCLAALGSWKNGNAPLPAVEGFIRQVLGWREFIRGVYWLYMPDYAESNFLDAKRPLPSFYWTGHTKMKCMRQAIGSTIRNAYAHHIQRLMVTGNFALLAGINPKEVQDWYLAVYADAFEWVELPNTHGMALHADGGILGSKPYAASGAYINRMSDYCKGCAYNHKEKTGENACPFNFLYWNFLMENERKLSSNPRMGMPYRNLARMDGELKDEIRKTSSKFLENLK